MEMPAMTRRRFDLRTALARGDRFTPSGRGDHSEQGVVPVARGNGSGLRPAGASRDAVV